ncbi:class E sortase [Streptomyces erythrochromogenes]|uniref:class E sortase n=1 Tax=Streptomyces erythrochromogenes TaxID=285574 RepID=UPI0038660627|nr:class E sortase [Streptomyces erythrochromogenes]
MVVQGRGRRARRAGLVGVLWATAELTVTVGVVVLLLVVHQVWWTNRQAAAAAQEQVRSLEQSWGREEAASPERVSGDDPLASGLPASSPDPSSVHSASPASPASSASSVPAPRPSERAAGAHAGAYAVLRIPRLGLVVPVAQGIDKRGVLDKGYVGQYPGTAGPGAQGNFALAGHRNTHGEPFRYVNRLRAGDELIVDVRGRRYTYVVGRILSETTERDTGVIAPVPRSVVKPEHGYSEPGSYITLTTCTPEYSSKYRLVVWGTLRP